MRPTIKTLLDAVKERGLSIRVANGQACLHGDPREATPELITAMKFFRKEIIADLGLEETALRIVENEDDELEQPTVPDDAVIVVADKDGYTDKNMRSEPYMWCWIGSTKWYYVRDFPIPARKPHALPTPPS
jgi:hypothetical protein